MALIIFSIGLEIILLFFSFSMGDHIIDNRLSSIYLNFRVTTADTTESTVITQNLTAILLS